MKVVISKNKTSFTYSIYLAPNNLSLVGLGTAKAGHLNKERYSFRIEFVGKISSNIPSRGWRIINDVVEVREALANYLTLEQLTYKYEDEELDLDPDSRATMNNIIVDYLVEIMDT